MKQRMRKILKSMFENYCKNFQRRTARRYVLIKNLPRQVFLCL